MEEADFEYRNVRICHDPMMDEMARLRVVHYHRFFVLNNLLDRVNVVVYLNQIKYYSGFGIMTVRLSTLRVNLFTFFNGF